MITELQRPGRAALPASTEGWLFQYAYHGWPVLLLPDGTIMATPTVNIADWGCFRRMTSMGVTLRHPLHCILCVEGRDAKGNPAPNGPARALPGLEKGSRDPVLVVQDIAIPETLEVRAEVLDMLEYRPPFWKSKPFEIPWGWDAVNMAIGHAKKSGYRGLVLKRTGSGYTGGESRDWIELEQDVMIRKASGREGLW